MKMWAIVLGLVVALIAPAASAQIVSAPLQKIVTPVDPMTMATDDFTRLANPAIWDGLSVNRIEFREDRAFWRLYRIVNLRHPGGPLWFVPHDNENAAFQAAVFAVRSYGGVVIAIEEARSIDGPDSRMNPDVAYGRSIDPNRNFRDDTPSYAATVLADLGSPTRLIVALHTNEPGYSASESTCTPPDAGYTGKARFRCCCAATSIRRVHRSVRLGRMMTPTAWRSSPILATAARRAGSARGRYPTPT